jgi:small conductance mechanosensitive channel
MHAGIYVKTAIKWFMTSGLQITAILCLMGVSFKVVNTSIESFLGKIINSGSDTEQEKRVQTLRSIITSVLNIAILAVGSMIILEKLGFNIAPILAAAGVVGVAVGFGSQRLVEDIISGLIILIDDQIRVGDFVKIGDKTGLVEKIDLKMVVLRDVEGNVHFIRNGKIDSITNMTKDYSCCVFEVTADAKESIEQIIEVIKSTTEDLRNNSEFSNEILEPVEIFGLDKFNDASIVIKARLKTKPNKQWLVGRELNLALKHKFDELNIKLV